MKKTVHEVTHEGWFGICPIWMAWHEGEPMPIPKAGQWWLLETAAFFQNLGNILASWFDPEFEPGWVFVLKPLKAPKQISA